jgi:hypothetical protein
MSISAAAQELLVRYVHRADTIRRKLKRFGNDSNIAQELEQMIDYFMRKKNDPATVDDDLRKELILAFENLNDFDSEAEMTAVWFKETHDVYYVELHALREALTRHNSPMVQEMTKQLSDFDYSEYGLRDCYNYMAPFQAELKRLNDQN